MGGERREDERRGNEGRGGIRREWDWCPPHDLFARRPCLKHEPEHIHVFR